jgi:hypothetical protein
MTSKITEASRDTHGIPPVASPLARFLGAWREVGHSHASPFGPHAPISSVQHFDFLAASHVLVHRLTGRWGTNEIGCIEVTTLELATDILTTRSFYNDGSSRTWTGRQISDGFLFTGEQVVDDRRLHIRYAQTFSAPDELRVRFEFSRDNVVYQPFWESLLTRAHPAS